MIPDLFRGLVLRITGGLAAGMLFGFIAPALGKKLKLRTATGATTTGGLGIIALWWIILLFGNTLPVRVLLGLGAASALILAFGLWDARRQLGPWPQLTGQLLASLAAVGIGGIVVRYVTNPFGGLLYLDRPSLLGFAAPGALLTILWILVLMNAMNFLDGVDGLAAAVSIIGFITIAATSLLPQVREPAVVLPAVVAAATAAGFLYWNIPPARLYLGTSGAWFLGFLLAVLSALGSTKIATLAVVSAVPLLDAVHVVLSRIRRGASPFRGDATHLHHRLLARGWSPRAILGSYTGASVLLALAAVLFPTPLKILLFLLGALSVAVLAIRPRREPYCGIPRCML